MSSLLPLVRQEWLFNAVLLSSVAGCCLLSTSNMLQLLTIAAALCSVVSASSRDASHVVHTSTGKFTGHENPAFPGVKEFRSIPYAQPPVGQLRFQPPRRLDNSTEHHSSQDFPPSCPQFVVSRPSFYNQAVPYLLIDNGHQNHSSGLPAENASEDCLYLSMWTPKDVCADSNLPVAFFMTGGHFTTGGVNIPGQFPAAWVDRSREHIVVTINYRVNIFGFPNAAASASPNVGMLDQRMALEWVSENIAAFGGDPSRILLWGQSAGAISVDYHNFAFWDNPISHASFSQSGTAIKALEAEDRKHKNFTFVADHLGCNFPEDKDAELRCMQGVPTDDILNFVNHYNGSDKLIFLPVADEKLIFSNYTDRALNGYLSPNPAMFTDVANNNATLVSWPSANPAAGPNETAVIQGTLADWVCPTAGTSILRTKAGLLTYRAQYAGNFSNQTPYPWMGAYHCADLAMFFGTYDYNALHSNSTPTALERATSEAMQDYLLVFMRDPFTGLQKSGWAPYANGSTILRFGADGMAVQNVSSAEIDGPCYGKGQYDPYP